eukprot:TRINITY_DN1705_c0_g1_i1.p1 TRINITY_DN1705_c0_g1~~TRINITY_DN1705_c0_g1_i1.p1  ORF type:complete len:335 (+),score=103.03 TRINITY_DN1705_c0_g1_i1:239-1243(+)
MKSSMDAKEIKELKSLLEAKDLQLSEREQTIADLEQNKEINTKEIQKLNQMLEENEQRHEKEMKDTEEERKKLQELTQREREEWKMEKEKLIREAREMENQIQKLQSEVNTLSTKQAELLPSDMKEMREGLLLERETDRKNIEGLTLQCQKIQDELKCIQADRDRLADELEETRISKDKEVQSILEILQGEYGADGTNSVLLKKFEALTLEKRNLEKDLEIKKLESSRDMTKISEMEKRLSELKSVVPSLINSKAQKAKLEQDLRSLQVEFDNAQEDYRSTIATLKFTIASEKKRFENIISELYESVLIKTKQESMLHEELQVLRNELLFNTNQ